MTFILGACSTGHVSSTPSRAPLGSDSVAANVKTSSWTPRITAGMRHYLIHDSSTVSISNDTTSHVLPIESIMLYSMVLEGSGDSFKLTSHIDSLTINSQLSIKSTSDTGKISEFRTTLSRQGRLTLSAEQAGTVCTAANATASSRVGELIISYPTSRLKVGDKWTDTLSTTNCHGKIPLKQQATREYELLDLSSCLQRDAVKVRRIVFDAFIGTSVERNNHLSANGSGTATSILCIQRDSGDLLESNGQSRTDLTVVTTRGTFPFVQNTTTHIELR
jgi:hypothetical protein